MNQKLSNPIQQILNISKIYFIVNVLFFLIPVAFLLGNFAINLMILLISLVSFIFFRKKLFDIKSYKIIYYFFAFFVMVIISSLIEFYNNPAEGHLIKSVLYLRFFILFLAVTVIANSRVLDIKYFFLSCLICSVFTSIDIIYQFIFNKDLFGITSPYTRSFTGFFGTERIAGSYIQRFLILGIFSLFLFNKDSKIINFLFVIFFVIGISGIVLSGNRMPLILLLIFMFLSFVIIKKIRYGIIFSSIAMIPIYFFLINNHLPLKVSHQSFSDNVRKMIPSVVSELNREYPELKENKGNLFYQQYKHNGVDKKKYEILSFGSGHTNLFITGIDTWLDSPLIGSGIRSFRIKCKSKMHLPNRICENHPHNYYLSIINTTGVAGLIFVLLGLGIVLSDRYRIERSNNGGGGNLLILSGLLLVLLIEFFPLRSSGSFFATANAFYIFLVLGLATNKDLYKK